MLTDTRDYLTVVVLQIFHVYAVVILRLKFVFYALDPGRKVTVIGVRRNIVNQLMQRLGNERLCVKLFVLYKPDAVPEIHKSFYFLTVDKRRWPVYVHGI